MSLTIALPKESATGELRVALDPPTVERLIAQHGVHVCIQSGCGRGAGFYDDDYEDVSVVDDHHDVVANAQIVVRVKAPSVEEASSLPEGSVLVTQMHAYLHVDVIEVLLQRRITTLAMDLVPRITRAQPMDVLSSQATVIGYKAALLAAELSPRLFPMLTTAAGTIRPSRVIVIGAGVAGLQAIATARRLGAQVEAYDIRSAAKEQIESLGARMIDTGVNAEGSGGYARALTKDEKRTQHDVLAERMSHAHAVICTAAIPGRRAPRIITEDMVEGMMPDTVIVDAAADAGGNCMLTRPGETYMHGDTLIVGALNLASSGAVHASEMYARNLLNMLRLIVMDGALTLDWEDEVLAGCLLTHDGGLYHEPTAELMNRDAEPPIGARPPVQADAPNQAAGWIEPDKSVDERQRQAADADEHDASPADAGDDSTPEPAEAASDRQAPRDEALATTDKGAESASTDAGEAAAVDVEEGESSRTIVGDDLTQIDGVGPALQNRLYAYGFTHFAQLAALDEEGAHQLEQQLELDEGQILEQDWLNQAGRLDRSA